MDEEKKDAAIFTVSPEKFSQSTAVLTDIVPKRQHDDDDADTRCGFGSWTPDYLQKAANTKLFLFFYSMAGLVQGAQFTYLIGCMSTLEKRFAYNSKRSGIIMISDEIAPICLGALIGYFGGIAHRPRLLAFGMFLGSVSSFIMCLPYFMYGPVRFDDSFDHSVSKFPGVKAQFCDKGYNSGEDTCKESVTTPVFIIFVMSNFLKGITSVIYYTMGTSYMDDSIKKKNSPIYLSEYNIILHSVVKKQ